MTRKRDPLLALWQAFISQWPPPSKADMKYVLALRAELDRRLAELAVLKHAETKHD